MATAAQQGLQMDGDFAETEVHESSPGGGGSGDDASGIRIREGMFLQLFECIWRLNQAAFSAVSPGVLLGWLLFVCRVIALQAPGCVLS